ncbi:hypothetical protein LPJ66_010027, partial [Kickxella alabastrina]
MSFGSNNLNSAVAQIDAKISEIESTISSATNDAQVRVSRDLKRAWESVYNALTLSPSPANMSGSYATWAANSSPRTPTVAGAVRATPSANAPLEPRDTAAVGENTAPRKPCEDAAVRTPSCGECLDDVKDILWVCTRCNGHSSMCNPCKAAKSSYCSKLGHPLVAWPLENRSIGKDQYVICDHCSEAVVGLRWHCSECKSFDSCNDCYIKNGRGNGHEHLLSSTYFSDTEAQPSPSVIYECSECNGRMGVHESPVFCCLECSDYHLCPKCVGKGKMCKGHDYCAIAQYSTSISSKSASACLVGVCGVK